MEQEMRYIWQVWQEGSFSRAAEKLYMTQPALSIAVKRVEAGLGAELFDRSRHPLELTQAGEAYIETIRRVRYLEEELERQIEDLRGLRTGRVRVGGTHFINCYLLAGALAEFAALWPGVELELMEASSADLAAALARRELDLTFSCDPELVARFEHRPAFRDHILLAVHEQEQLPDDLLPKALTAADILQGVHLREETARVSLASFRELPFILLGPGNNLNTRGREMFREAGFEPKIKMLVSQMVTSFRLADNGLGAAFVSDRLIRTPSSHLRFFRLEAPQAGRLFYLLRPERSYTPVAVRTFADFAVEQIRRADLDHGRDWGVPEK